MGAMHRLELRGGLLPGRDCNCGSGVQVVYAGHPQLALQPRHDLVRMNSMTHLDILFGIVVLQLDHLPYLTLPSHHMTAV
jgi:hypothetical protein